MPLIVVTDRICCNLAVSLVSPSQVFDKQKLYDLFVRSQLFDCTHYSIMFPCTVTLY